MDRVYITKEKKIKLTVVIHLSKITGTSFDHKKTDFINYFSNIKILLVKNIPPIAVKLVSRRM
jgi:hypothetical protein